jgi:hypothetical protein
VELCTAIRPESIKIHQKLLESKYGASAAALGHGFKEGASMRMTFQETRYETEAQFVVWAYRGDHTDMVPLPADLPAEAKSEPSSDSSLDAGVKMLVDDFSKARTPSLSTLSCSSDSPQAHPLRHLRVYIFSNIYMIPGLAFEKLTTVLKLMGKPQCMTEQLAIIDCLELAFSKVPVFDMLPRWLAQHAFWCMEELRLQSRFHDLLRRLPGIGSRMMDSLRPAQLPPWEMELREYAVPLYDAQNSSDDSGIL